MDIFTFNVIKILIISVFAMIFSLILAKPLINFLNKIKFWKKEARTKTITGEEANIIYELHKEREIKIPRGGGLIIWLSVLIIIFLFYFLSSIISNPWWFKKLNFLSRSETWLPLFTLITASIVGFSDDFLQVFKTDKKKYIGGGMSFWGRLLIVSLIGLIGGLWFYYKLEWDTIHIPLIYNFPNGIDISIGFWYIPLFIFIMIASWATGVVDGLDGLASGLFAIIFSAFTIISFSQGKIELATFCAVITGTLFAFLWFNIPPARFYMGETGILGLTSVMTVVAFLTNSILVLPIIAGVLVIEVSSIILQLLSKKFLKKKIFLATPIHHHFEAMGWPAHKVTMRFWIVGVILAILGTTIKLAG